MKPKVLTKIINFIREEMMAAGTGGFSGSSNPKGPTAGFDPVMGKKKKYIYMRGVRKNWKKSNGKS
tara:strand:+ start:885 stop:1082 length:198 start_codon:yes stop_codon:yes gene_type:complete